MTEQQLEQVVALIQGTWPYTTIAEANQEPMMTAWMSLLGPYEAEDVVAVIHDMIEAGREFPPVLPALIKPLREKAKERERLAEYDDPTKYVAIPSELLPILNAQSPDELELPIEERMERARRQLRAVAP